MMNPLISIIIPTYNRAHLIIETLESVLAQSYANWECIVVDDGSTDNTFEILTAFVRTNKRFYYYQRPKSKPKGPSSCRNCAVEVSKGDYIIFLDSDDLLASTCLENRIIFALQNIKYDFWIFKMAAFDENLNNIIFIYDKIPNEEQNIWCKIKFMNGEQPFVITGPFWRKNTLISLNGFDEQLTMIEDPDLHLRALKHNYKFKYAALYNEDCYYRLSNNLCSKYSVNSELENALRFFKKHLNYYDKAMFVSFKNVFNRLIFENKKWLFFLRFFILGFRLKIFSSDKFIFGFVIMFYKSVGLDKITGLGYNRIKLRFNNF